MAQITQRVMTALYSALSAGFNNAVNNTAGGYGLIADKYQVDWSDSSQSVYRAAADPADLDRTTASRYPLVCIYGLSSSNQNFTKFSRFSGFVTIAMDIHLSWTNAGALTDFESAGNLIEDVVIDLINSTDWQSYSVKIAWNGNISLTRTPLIRGAQGWLQSMKFQMTFQVDL